MTAKLNWTHENEDYITHVTDDGREWIVYRTSPGDWTWVQYDGDDVERRCDYYSFATWQEAAEDCEQLELLDWLRKAYKDNSVSVYKIGEALVDLAKSKSPSLEMIRIKEIEEALKHPSSIVRDFAALALSILDDPRAIPALKKAIEREKNEELRHDMQETLQNLKETRDDPKEETHTEQEHAAFALRKLMLRALECCQKPLDMTRNDFAYGDLVVALNPVENLSALDSVGTFIRSDTGGFRIRTLDGRELSFFNVEFVPINAVW